MSKKTFCRSLENHPSDGRLVLQGENEPVQTLRARMGTGGGNVPMILEKENAAAVGNGQMHQTDLGDKTGALNCMHDQQAVVVQGGDTRRYILRRLTPVECARLQGFPDWWCEGLGGSDSAIYKAYGNGLALPCAFDVLNRIAQADRREKAQEGGSRA